MPTRIWRSIVAVLRAGLSSRRRRSAGPAPSRSTPDVGHPRIAWRTFLDTLSSLARAQLSASWDQAAYVEQVASLMLQLDPADAWLREQFEGLERVAGQPALARVHPGVHFEVLIIELGVGDEIPLHNHPDMTGVILCLSGEVEVDSFDVLEPPNASGRLLLERSERAILRPRDHATLTARRGNIHVVQGRERARLIDVFTPPYDPHRRARARRYTRASSPCQGPDIYEAWEIPDPGGS